MAPHSMYQKGSYSLDPFAPSGEPKNLNEEGASKPDDEVGANVALAELGAGITKAKKYSSLKVDAQKIDVPKEDQKGSIYNQKV